MTGGVVSRAGGVNEGSRCEVRSSVGGGVDGPDLGPGFPPRGPPAARVSPREGDQETAGSLFLCRRPGKVADD